MMKSVKKFLTIGFALLVAFTNIQFLKTEAAETKTENAAKISDETESTQPGIQMVAKADVTYSADDSSLPVLDGYYFAGWYKTNQPEENPTELNKEEVYTSMPGEGEAAWAKFVPEKVLAVAAQIPTTVKETQNPEGGKTPLRLVTTVDNLYYREVGFTITINGKSIPQEAKTVYKTLFVVGDTGQVDTKTPETSFCNVSHYFAACTIDNIPKEAWNAEIQVVPYWITLDGTRVEGISVVKEVEMGRDNQAKIGNDWYWTLNYAIQQANEVTSEVPVVQVLRDIQLTSGLSAITNSMTITTDGNGFDKKITTVADSRIFHINGSNNVVTIKGTETERLILEGTGETGSKQQLIYAQSCQKATLENVDVKNANRSSGAGGAITGDDSVEFNFTKCNFDNCKITGSGGAIRCGKSTLKQCNFTDCSASSHGGAIYTVSELIIDKCYFTDCKATTNGGAVYCKNILEVAGSSFDTCTAKSGGAIYKDGTAQNGMLDNCEFSNNSAASSGGAMYVIQSIIVDVKNCKFDNNTTPAGGAGGAIYFSYAGATLNLLGSCEFTNNKAGGTKDTTGIKNAGGAIAAPQNLNIGDDEGTATIITMSGNACTRSDYGGAICVVTTVDSQAQFKIKNNASLHVEDNSSAICLQYGGGLTIKEGSDRYFQHAPSTQP